MYRKGTFLEQKRWRQRRAEQKEPRCLPERVETLSQHEASLAFTVISAYQVALLITPKRRRCSWLAAQIKVDPRPRRWLTPVALVILRAQGSHGYELMERIQQFGFEKINPGTLYRTLKADGKRGPVHLRVGIYTEQPTMPNVRNYGGWGSLSRCVG
jgi:hypothetical protein